MIDLNECIVYVFVFRCQNVQPDMIHMIGDDIPEHLCNQLEIGREIRLSSIK